MAHVLHVQASPRGDESFSVRTARAFLEAYAKTHPGDTIETLDLAARPPIDLGGEAAGAKMQILGGQAPTADQAKAWARVTETIRHLKKADKLLISSPMWNFALPYRLKHYIDVVVLPGETFRYTPEGKIQGLMAGRPCMLILARGGRYASGTPAAAMDFQLPYLKAVLGFIGIEKVSVILVEPTASEGPDAAKKTLDAAIADARRRAADF